MQLRVVGNDDKTTQAFVQKMLEKLVEGVFCLLHYPSSAKLRDAMEMGQLEWQDLSSLAHVRFLWHDEIRAGDAMDQYLDSLPRDPGEEKNMPLVQNSGGFPKGNTLVVAAAGTGQGTSNPMARACHNHFVSLITSERHAGFRAGVEAWMMGRLAEEAALALDGALPRESDLKETGPRMRL
jgi:hypothetical protein